MPRGLTHLFIPGPTNVPDVVRRAMNVPMEDHRAPDFPRLTHGLFEDLKTVFANTTGRVFLYPSSGTGAWEAAITNTLQRGDRVLMARFGQFSHLWVDMAQRLGLDVVCLDVPWGEGVPLDQYADHLAADPSIRGVFVTHNETATGVTSDVAGVRRAMDAAGSDALLFVDGVSSIASIDFRQDAWGVDLAVSGSQKGLMLPPGLAVLSVSEKALQAHAALEGGGMERCYFSFTDMVATNDAGYFPYTPADPAPARAPSVSGPAAGRGASPGRTRATTGWPRASGGGSPHSAWSCVRPTRCGTPTRSPRSGSPRTSTATTWCASPTSATARRSVSGWRGSRDRSSGSATSATATR